MKRKPDIWMPIYVGDYLADTCHLNAEEHGAYFLLLMHQWRVGHFSDGSITAITRGASSTSQATVKHMLSTDQAGLFYSPRLDREKEAWIEKKGTYVKRASAGGRARAEKYASSSASSSASSTTQAVLEVCTSPSPKEQIQIPSRRQKTARVKKVVEVGDAKEPTKSDLAKIRHAEFKAMIGEYWSAKNPGVQMPWDGREGKHLEMFLRAAPEITATQFKGFLRNRFKSEVNHGERASMWIDWVTSYAAGPMDKYGKTIGTGETKQSQPKPKILSRPGE